LDLLLGFDGMDGLLLLLLVGLLLDELRLGDAVQWNGATLGGEAIFFSNWRRTHSNLRSGFLGVHGICGISADCIAREGTSFRREVIGTI